ncbi:MAG: ABC transporter ATP-binding protein [Deltaproteobacteria bacterium]|nr:ABC transporter ATP-binding protein [Deltaproteobacteria bacterium]
MPTIDLRNISNFICRAISLKILSGELLVLLGPTGAGKTTLLNIISGLIPYEGSILFDDEPIDKIPVSRRGIGYLFQGLALFPHLDVRRNIIYGLSATKCGSDVIQARLTQMCSLLQVGHLLERYPKDLSGGERQRVALARSLAAAPRVLLLDEPFNSLDIKTRKYLRLEFKRIVKTLGLTTIFVTHDFKEAEEVGDRLAVMASGSLEQVATPREIFFSPNGRKVAEFLGSPNIFTCDSHKALGNGLVEANCGGLSIIMVWEHKNLDKVSISPEEIYVSRHEPPGPSINRFSGTIVEEICHDSVVTITIRTGSWHVLAKMRKEDFVAENLKAGSDVFFILPLRHLKGT